MRLDPHLNEFHTFLLPELGRPEQCPPVCGAGTRAVMSITVYQMTVYPGLPGSIAVGADHAPSDAIIADATEQCMDQFGCARNCRIGYDATGYLTGYFRGQIHSIPNGTADAWWSVIIPLLRAQGANPPGTITMLGDALAQLVDLADEP